MSRTRTDEQRKLLKELDRLHELRTLITYKFEGYERLPWVMTLTSDCIQLDKFKEAFAYFHKDFQRESYSPMAIGAMELGEDSGYHAHFVVRLKTDWNNEIAASGLNPCPSDDLRKRIRELWNRSCTKAGICPADPNSNKILTPMRNSSKARNYLVKTSKHGFCVKPFGSIYIKINAWKDRDNPDSYSPITDRKQKPSYALKYKSEEELKQRLESFKMAV